MRLLLRALAALALSGAVIATSSCGWMDRVGLMPGSAPEDAARRSESAMLPDDGAAGLPEGASGPAAPRPPPLPRVKPTPPPAASKGSSADAPRKVDAAGLVGLSEAEIEGLLGTPKSETLAQPARIREYRDAACGVRLYLYVDLKSEKYRVLHMQPIPAGLDARQADRCVARIARRATGTGAR